MEEQIERRTYDTLYNTCMMMALQDGMPALLPYGAIPWASVEYWTEHYSGVSLIDIEFELRSMPESDRIAMATAEDTEELDNQHPRVSAFLDELFLSWCVSDGLGALMVGQRQQVRGIPALPRE